MPNPGKKHTYTSIRASAKHTSPTVDDNGLHIPPPTEVAPRRTHIISPPSEPAGAKSQGERASYHNMTITDDHSEGSDIKRRKLMAVAGPENSVNLPGLLAQRAISSNGDSQKNGSPEGTPSPTGSFERPEYTMPDADAFGYDPRRFLQPVDPQVHENFDFDMGLKRGGDNMYYRVLPPFGGTDHTDGALSDHRPPKRPRKTTENRHPPSKVRIDEENNPNPQIIYSPATGISSLSRAVDDTARAGYHSNSPAVVDEIQRLRYRVVELESQLQNAGEAKQRRKPPRLQVLYRLQDDSSRESLADKLPFEDEPEIIKDKGDTAYLRCRNRVSNLELYLLRHPDISFVVYRTYPKTIRLGSKKAQPCSQPVDQLHLPSPLAESILPVEKKLKQALEMVLERKPEFRQILNKYLDTGELDAPYLFIYHSRNDLENIRSVLPLDVLKLLELLLEYVEYAFGHEYHEADGLLKKGNMAPTYIRYMAKPGDVLIASEGKYHTGFVAESWLSSMQETPSISTSSGRKTIVDSAHSREECGYEYGVAGELIDEPGILNHASDSRTPQSSLIYTWTLTGKTLEFDGCFYWKRKLLKIEMSADSPHQASAITNLNIFPLRHGPKELSDLLQRRGSMFWKCRTKNLVSYQPGDDDEFSRTVGYLQLLCSRLGISNAKINRRMTDT